MKSVLKFASLCVLSVVLNGCLLNNMEKITEDTRDSVKDTNQVIRGTEELQKISSMHTLMLNESAPYSARVRATKIVLAKYPEKYLAGDLGMLLPTFHVPSFKKSIGGAEVELLNVPYVAEKKISRILNVAAIDPAFFDIVSFAAIQLTQELETVTKTPGLSAEEMDGYREIARRLTVIVPAILGAVNLEPMEQTLQTLLNSQKKGQLELTSFTQKAQTSARSGVRSVSSVQAAPALTALEQLAVNVSLTEDEMREMRALISVRLGIN